MLLGGDGRHEMSLDFNVGSDPSHLVSFHFNKMVGNLVISVDGNPVIKDFRLFSLKSTKRYELLVGEPSHEVAIEKRRPRIFAGFRSQEIVAYVDGEEVARGYA